jgi:hypothetical protein
MSPKFWRAGPRAGRYLVNGTALALPSLKQATHTFNGFRTGRGREEKHDERHPGAQRRARESQAGVQ